MRIALIDSDASFLAELSEQLQNALGSISYTVSFFSDGKSFFNTWKAGSYELVILDVALPDMLGIDAARTIRKTDITTRLVFCSYNNGYASESYEVYARDYMKKPVSDERLSSMLNRLGLEEIERTRCITLPDGVLIKPSDILYTEYENHVVTITLKNGELYKIRISHLEMEARLAPLGHFFSPYRGVLVNLSEATSISGESFTLSNGSVLPIARRKYKEARHAYLRCKSNN